MRRMFDSLFARVLGVQLLLALAITVLLATVALRQQNQEMARHIAPLWAAALRHDAAPPVEVEVAATVSLLPGPLPPDVPPPLLNPRYRALAHELQRLGIEVQTVRPSGRGSAAVTWLEVADREGGTRWLGVRGGLEGLEARDRGTLGLVLGLAAIALGAWWLSRRLLLPVQALAHSMQRFAAEGRLPLPPAPGAPRELRELAQQFGELARQRQVLDEERRTMLAAISHDLRSPLGRIRLAAELLPDEVTARRDSIVRNVQVADRLLGSFIDLARADEEAMDGAVDLALLVQALAGAEPSVRVQALPPDGPCTVAPASAVALERVLRNLVDNARVHGQPPVELSLQVSGGVATLAVRDHGRGIDPAQRTAMLQPFTRGTHSREQPGTGLGLAIVQRTVARHGGWLELSDAAPGLYVRVHLPLTRPH